MTLRSCLSIKKAHILSLSLLALLAPAAHAGHWQFSAPGSTDVDVVHIRGVLQPAASPAWAPPTAPSDNSLTLSLPGGAATDTNYGGSPSCDFHATATLHIVATWVSDTSSDNTTPSTVWFIETASASWTKAPNGNFGQATTGLATPGQPPPPTIEPVFTYDGGAANGLGDPYVPVGPPTSGSSTMDTTKTAPPDGWHSYPVSGGTVTLPVRTLETSASATVNTPGGVNITGSLTYSITVHAQPYDFRLGPFTDPNTNTSYTSGIADDGNGQLYFHYIWDSTDGNLAHLNDSVVYEHISNAGNTTGSYYSDATTHVDIYAPVNPPFNFTVEAAYDQPDPNGTNPTPGTAGYTVDVLIRGALSTPSAAGTYTYSSTQDWLFNDSKTGEKRVELLGPFTITRTVTGSPSAWSYTVSKSGSSASAPYFYYY